MTSSNIITTPCCVLLKPLWIVTNNTAHNAHINPIMAIYMESPVSWNNTRSQKAPELNVNNSMVLSDIYTLTD